MRIPNQLQGDPLYRRKRSGSGGDRNLANPIARSDPSWRRVIRLVVVLALVVVLMQQAAKPGVYQVFFPPSPQAVVDPVVSPHAVNTLGETVAFASNAPSTVQEQAVASSQSEQLDYSEPAKELAAARDPADLLDWMSSWISNPSQTDLEEWDLPEWVSTDAAQVALVHEIQRRLIEEVKDGTVWRAADTPALLVSLALHRPAAPQFNVLRMWRPPAEVAGVLPLLQQPGVYRGKSLIARGDVVRVEQITAPKNEFGLKRYFNLWLMPKDASARPWLVIVAELPQEMSGLVAGPTSAAEPNSWPVTSPYPLVNVRGEFIKRLSYQSAAGAELTPVVVGHVESIQANGNQAIAIPRVLGSGTNQSVAKRPSTAWAVVFAIVAGVCFSGWVMWRTAKLNRQLRERRQRKSVQVEVAILIFVSWFSPTASAESVLDLMPGFAPSELQSIVTPSEREIPVGDLNGLVVDTRRISQLVYRFSRLSEPALRKRHRGSIPTDATAIGDAVDLKGSIVQTRTLAVPEELADVLEFSDVQIVKLSNDSAAPMVVVMRAMSVAIQTGDQLSGSGALIGKLNGADVFVAGRLAWSPSKPTSASAGVLSSRGVDLSRLAEVSAMGRKPLSPEDSGVFFRLIGAAREVSQSLRDDDVVAMRRSVIAASPVDLLSAPRDFTGQWISFKVETVRITRVAVESEQRQSEVGGLFYYQIDAIGDLGKVQLKIEVPDGEPVTMENRYPVTIVTAKLPKFLQDKEGDWVSTITAPIEVEGWFYRLWSYESDFMESRGGKQVAPLIVGSVIRDRRTQSADPIGVRLIGRIAAIGVVVGILATIIFSWITRRGDRASRERRSVVMEAND